LAYLLICLRQPCRNFKFWTPKYTLILLRFFFFPRLKARQLSLAKRRQTFNQIIMKNLLLLFVISLFLIPIASSQSNLCPDNIFINGDLENGTPSNSHQDIANAVGYSRIWAPGSWADYYTATTGPFTPPTPATGNYVGCWIANFANGGTTYREGFKGELAFTLPPNTGTHTLTFDMACLAGWGNSEVAVYALHNPTGADASSPPTGAFTPNNMSLFPSGSTFLLNTIALNLTGCTNTKTNHSVTINTNAANYPAGGMTHIFITHSDNSTINGAYYMGFDNFCLAASNDCPASYASNGDLESGTPTASHQDINNATDFQSIWAGGSSADYYTATAGPFTPPTPATGNYVSCWIANFVNGGTTYREGFQSKLVAPILTSTGSYTLKFDMACLYGWGVSEVAVYGINNPTNTTSSVPTGAFTPSNIALFGAGSTVLLGTITVDNSNCSNTKVNQSLTFNSNAAGFPTEMTHFYVTHSDNSSINGARYMGFDNFCLQSAQDTVIVTVPCPKITNTDITCIPDVNGDGVPDYNIQISVNNPGILNFTTTCGTIFPASLPVATAGVYNLTFVSNGTCSPFLFEYQSLDANQRDCWRDEIIMKLPPCKQKECLCDQTFFDDVDLGFNATLACPDDIFAPIELLDCDRVTWLIDGTPVAYTTGNNLFIHPHISGQYEVCMIVVRTLADGTTCDHKFCRIMQSSLSCRSAIIGVAPNPASNQLSLTWSTDNVPDELSISIFNSNGIQVQRINAINGHEGQMKINVQKLETGLYFIKVEGAQYAPMPIKFVKKG
jgi:hypothetical protein